MFRESCEAHSAKQDGGEEGIRTLEKLLTSTPLAGERLRPLGHLSGGSPVKKSRRTINKAFGLGARSGVNFGRRLSSGRTGGARYARASARHHFQTIYIASIHRVRLLEAPLDRRARRITGLSGWPADLRLVHRAKLLGPTVPTKRAMEARHGGISSSTAPNARFAVSRSSHFRNSTQASAPRPGKKGTIVLNRRRKAVKNIHEGRGAPASCRRIQKRR
jgi:hypothetical protein